MIRSAKLKKPPVPVYEDYYARIQRQSLRYGISHYDDGYSAPKPYSRHLELHGEMLWPEGLCGLPFTADLIGDPGRIELPKAFENSVVASLRKREEKVWLTTFVPIEFIPSLSAAYHDDRLQFVIASGPKLKRNESLLTYLSFAESNYTEQHWGMPWVTANDPKTEPDGAAAASKAE